MKDNSAVLGSVTDTDTSLEDAMDAAADRNANSSSLPPPPPPPPPAGKGGLTPEEVKEPLQQRVREAAGQTAPTRNIGRNLRSFFSRIQIPGGLRFIAVLGLVVAIVYIVARAVNGNSTGKNPPSPPEITGAAAQTPRQIDLSSCDWRRCRLIPGTNKKACQVQEECIKYVY